MKKCVKIILILFLVFFLAQVCFAPYQNSITDYNETETVNDQDEPNVDQNEDESIPIWIWVVSTIGVLLAILIYVVFIL